MSEVEEMNTMGGDAGMTGDGGEEKMDHENMPAMPETNESEVIEMQGEMHGHTDWVTCIVTSLDNPDMLLSGSRDKSVLVWKLERKVEEQFKGAVHLVEGTMVRRLVGHSSFVQDIDISSDRKFALSASWDGTMRLWNIETGETTRRFDGHGRDVLSVAFSPNNRQIVSGSRDHTVKVWNTIGEMKESMAGETGHSNWVTCCRFSPNAEEPVIVTASRDRKVKVWDSNNFNLKHDLIGHQDYVNSVTVSPDGSLCASGGKDGIALLWDLNEGKKLSSLDAGGEILALSFSPNRYWLCGAVGAAIKIWDLETKVLVGTLAVKKKKRKQEEQQPQRNRRGPKKKKKKKLRAPLPVLCTCMAWSHDGKTLFAGYSDTTIRVWSFV